MLLRLISCRFDYLNFRFVCFADQKSVFSLSIYPAAMKPLPGLRHSPVNKAVFPLVIKSYSSASHFEAAEIPYS